MSKRRSSTVPALYSDLSQSSQPTAETQSSLMDSQFSLCPGGPVITSVSSLVTLPTNQPQVEEDAMMGPPSPVASLEPEEIAIPSMQDKENPSSELEIVC